MSDIDLQAIRRRVDSATEGPWETVPTVGHAVVAACDDGYWQDVADQIETEADAEFVAASRTDVPALLAEVERLSSLLAYTRESRDAHAAALDRVREALAAWDDEGLGHAPGTNYPHAWASIRTAIEGADS